MRRHDRRFTGPRRALGIAAVCLAPVVLLGAAELALRGLGIGDPLPLFVSVPGDPARLRANPDVIGRFYRRAPELAIEQIPFARAKPADRYRIVVAGGSTAAGFPYGRWAGLAGMLGDRIACADPDREVDVVTTAMAAVNSYALLDFVDEVVAVEPDAVLIYAGHNEYLGILGVGSALTASRWRWATLLHLSLRELRLYQQIRQLAGAVTSLGAGVQSRASRGTLMAGAARSRRIDFGSDAYRRGLDQFEANLSDILAGYRRAGVRVYVATLVSNERDLPPFDGGPSRGVDAVRWRQLREAVEQARARGDADAARAEAEALIALDPAAGDAWYALGAIERDAGRLGAARDAYRAARDRDRLRFRAPEAFNSIVRRQAERHGARVVDVQRAFADASPDGIIGHELISEHVHPTAEGYFLLADAFYRALLADGQIAESPEAPDRARALAEMPITEVDRLLADHAIRELTSDFPFRERRREVAFPPPTGAIERIAARRLAGEISWLEGMEALLQVHREAGRLGRAAVVARVAAQAYPDQAAPNASAGLLYAELGRFRLARRYLRRALEADPDHVAARRALARANAHIRAARPDR